eukprot:TRINITY_DN7307_c0_g1_i2.p1 TRINITY_DN7307_c0_g1~~TRINITY_DN7307_c0_g1_i2.p1  ORF type:complete len:322 (+),score=99.33 TRINITY_DN7307_c0_g1_i2:141-1106(+)
MLRSLVGSEMCIRDRSTGGRFAGMQLLTANHHGPLSRPTWDFAANFCRNQNPANGRDGDSFPPELQEDLRKLSELHTTAINTERLSNLHRGSCEGRLDAALAAKRQAVASREACVVTLKNAMAEFDMRQSEQMACNARSNEAAATLLWVTKGEQDAVLELEAAVREGRTARQEHKAAAKTRHDTFPMARLCSVLDHATTRAEAVSIYRMEDRRLRERDTLKCGQLLDRAMSRSTQAESALFQAKGEWEAATQLASEAIAAADAAKAALASAQMQEAKAIDEQQLLREAIRTKSMAYGGVAGYGFPQLQGYNESLRPLARHL